jgi:triphosphoribosyl-dephospho-CoA synthetase
MEQEGKMREFIITEARVKEIANVPDWLGSMALMKKWFPEAFEPEWEDVKQSDLELGNCCGHAVLNHRKTGGYPFEITIFEHSSTRYLFKIEDGRIYWRKP